MINCTLFDCICHKHVICKWQLINLNVAEAERSICESRVSQACKCEQCELMSETATHGAGEHGACEAYFRPREVVSCVGAC
jgi:hypothetical protein